MKDKRMIQKSTEFFKYTRMYFSMGTIWPDQVRGSHFFCEDQICTVSLFITENGSVKILHSGPCGA